MDLALVHPVRPSFCILAAAFLLQTRFALAQEPNAFGLNALKEIPADQISQTDPDKFWKFSKALFDKQTDFFDVNVVHEERNKTYERLSKIAGEVGIDEKTIYSLLEVTDKPDDGLNVGNGVTNDIKLMVKVRSIIVVWSYDNH